MEGTRRLFEEDQQRIARFALQQAQEAIHSARLNSRLAREAQRAGNTGMSQFQL